MRYECTKVVLGEGGVQSMPWRITTNTTGELRAWKPDDGALCRL